MIDRQHALSSCLHRCKRLIPTWLKRFETDERIQSPHGPVHHGTSTKSQTPATPPGGGPIDHLANKFLLVALNRLGQSLSAITTLG